jgi:hypoxanthine phosphoribosyltransferase
MTLHTCRQMRISPKTYEEIDVEDAMRHEIEDFTQEIHGDIRQFLDRSNILTSDEIKRSGNTIDIIKEVINSEALRNAITSLVSRIITSAQFQNACKQMIHNLWNDLIHDPDTTAQLVQLLNSALNNDIIRRSFKALVLNILQDDEVYHQLTRLVVRLSDDPAVRVFDLLKVHSTLELLHYIVDPMVGIRGDQGIVS